MTDSRTKFFKDFVLGIPNIKKETKGLSSTDFAPIVRTVPSAAKAQKQASATEAHLKKAKPAIKAEPRKNHTLTSAFANQAKIPKKVKEKVVFANPKDELEKEDEDEKESIEEKARKKADLESMFEDDDIEMGMRNSNSRVIFNISGDLSQDDHTNDVEALDDDIMMDDGPSIDEEKPDIELPVETEAPIQEDQTEQTEQTEESSEPKPKARKKKKVMKMVTKRDQLGYLSKFIFCFSLINQG